MAALATQNPPARSESKSAKKKKAKTPFDESAATGSAAETTTSNGATESNTGDGSYESPYIKELYKSIRNVNKKISHASKVDNILAENPDKSLDDLVAARKINADQKAQILNKPKLQESLAQLEEQINQYKKFDQEYKAKMQSEKAEYEKTFNDKASKELEESVAAAKAEAATNALREQHDGLLLISQFLRLAAIRRGDEEADATLDENKALEGVLAKVYTGDEEAVQTMLKIIQGSNVPTVSVSSEVLTTTYAEIKAAVLAQAPPITANEVDPSSEPAQSLVETDSTITNAGLTEIDAPATSTLTNGHEETYNAHAVPQNSDFGDGAANAAAEAGWDASNDLSASQEWVEVPRAPVDTSTDTTAAPAPVSNVQSWADDQPDAPEPATTPTPNPNDGFHEVHRSRGGNRGDGHSRGRGGRGGEGYRGRGGFRGDGRGRGRGYTRGGARGGRRPDES